MTTHRELDSTLIEITPQSISTLNYLESKAANENTRKVFTTILRLAELSTDQFVSFNEIFENMTLSRSAIRNRLNDCKSQELVDVIPAKSVFGSAAHARIEIFKFKPVANISKPPESTSPRKTAGRKSASIVSEQLSQEQVYVPANHRDDVVNAVQGLQLAIPRDISDVVAPGTTLTTRKEIVVTGPGGQKHLNFSESPYGIINDSDIQILNVLYQMSIQYLQNLPSHLQETVDESVRIPIWIDDLLVTLEKPDNTTYRQSISHALLKIQTTFYKLFRQSGFRDGLNEVPEGTLMFRWLAGMVVISKTGAQNKKLHDIETSSPDDRNIADKISADWGTDFPFVCVLLQWTPDFYKTLFKQKVLFAINTTAHKIPSTLYAIYSAVRNDYLSRKPRVFTGNHLTEFTMRTLIEFLWPAEKPESVNRLVIHILKDCNHAAAKFPHLVSKTETEPEHFNITIELFGVSLLFESAYLKRLDRAGNRDIRIVISVCKQNLIEETGAKFSNSKSNNAPVMPSPVFGLIGHPENSTKRRVLPSAVKLVKDKLDDLKVGKYMISFNIIGQTIFISKYNTFEELNKIFIVISGLTSLEETTINLYFTHLLRDVDLIDGLSFEDLDRFCKEVGQNRNTVLQYVIPRVRYIERMLENDMQELRGVF
ncbi:hypothetical protein TUMSATVNIG1_59820 (plasmid) [Vibrio nigripulchritudo]|uniref:hypothetical protein n=1 Tax=Vibrio nigripulchritudo TaxID=28173 RepID=UPI00190CCBD3|nr:hypothetical protein [Vibrio nigripulchritudo]BCL73996.1 hypothetical protein VNTUMSATTG_59330 [Vibrio nigripulchritudo]BDU35373.1 hypothetical protein TUMSATVNIG1_59820 [Vibrio nigripulchritudo]